MASKLQDFYRSLSRAGRFGLWGLLVIVPVTALYLVLVVGERAPVAGEYPNLTVLETGDRINRVRLVGEEGLSEQITEEQYVPVSSTVRDQVIQALSVFRASYKQLQPTITVEANPDYPMTQRVAETLVQMLGYYDLGHRGEQQESGPAGEDALVLRCSPTDIPVAYAFLSAIAPYVRGTVQVIQDPGHSPGRMRLALMGDPRFTQEGVAVFP